MLDGIFLTAMGATEMDGQVDGNLSVLYSLQLTPDVPQEGDARRKKILGEVQAFPNAKATPRGGTGLWR